MKVSRALLLVAALLALLAAVLPAAAATAAGSDVDSANGPDTAHSPSGFRSEVEPAGQLQSPCIALSIAHCCGWMDSGSAAVLAGHWTTPTAAPARVDTAARGRSCRY